MADRGNRLAGIVEGFDQCDRVWILRQIPHRAMTAGIEDRLVVVCVHLGEPPCVGEHGLGRGRDLLEATRQVGLPLRGVTDRIERRLPAFGEATVIAASASRKV